MTGDIQLNNNDNAAEQVKIRKQHGQSISIAKQSVKKQLHGIFLKVEDVHSQFRPIFSENISNIFPERNEFQTDLMKGAKQPSNTGEGSRHFCEICNEPYIDLTHHLSLVSHQSLSKQPNRFSQLDTFLDSLPSLDDLENDIVHQHAEIADRGNLIHDNRSADTK